MGLSLIVSNSPCEICTKDEILCSKHRDHTKQKVIHKVSPVFRKEFMIYKILKGDLDLTGLKFKMHNAKKISFTTSSYTL